MHKNCRQRVAGWQKDDPYPVTRPLANPMARTQDQPSPPAADLPPAGIGLRAPHYRELIDTRPAVGFVEIHSENYLGDGGAPLHYLEKARSLYEVSLHGVGMSLGSADPLNRVYLARLRHLIDRIDPVLVSDHLSWCSIDGVYLNDLLPLPYTRESLDHFCSRVTEAQDLLGRELLVENPSSYFEYSASEISEVEFLTEIARRTGCGILLDVNNLYVSSVNHGFRADDYLSALPVGAVGEIHLAGHSVRHCNGRELLIDTHGAPVSEPVWRLYEAAVRRFGTVPTLLEWDNDLPPLATLVDESLKASALCAGVRRAA